MITTSTFEPTPLASTFFCYYPTTISDVWLRPDFHADNYYSGQGSYGWRNFKRILPDLIQPESKMRSNRIDLPAKKFLSSGRSRDGAVDDGNRNLKNQ